MFTGLIEDVGVLRGRRAIEGGVRLDIESSLAGEMQMGDSLATNGVCLTVTAREGSVVSFDVSPETLRVTALARLTPGARVNLERPLRADARLGGHFVQGHVDATGRVTAIAQEGEFYRIGIAFPPELAPFLILKGSVAVDGISLTVADLASDRFDVQIIPHTWSHTTLSTTVVGDPVNLEGDLIGKYVVRLAALRQEPS